MPAHDVVVCLDARLRPGMSGGVESVIIGLAASLGQLEGPEKYLFMVEEYWAHWLDPYLGENSAAVVEPRTFRKNLRRFAEKMRKHAGPLGTIRAIPPSNGIPEQAQADVVHFLRQNAFRTRVPSIYHPHDLQHLHLPNFFSRTERRLREVRYRTFCGQADRVAVTSSWTKHDLLRQYKLSSDRVVVIPWAPAIDHYPAPTHDDRTRLRDGLDLPANFIYYPAHTWPHKNHLQLFAALARLREKGEIVPLVCSGHQTPYVQELKSELARLSLSNQVQFVGRVSERDLVGLYELATAVVIPSMFEAASGPAWEAFRLGVPCAVSAVTSLPEQAGDAALLFDPNNSVDIADKIFSLWKDAGLRADLVTRGRRKVAPFSWANTARTFRALYRQIAGRRLSREEEELLNQEALL